MNVLRILVAIVAFGVASLPGSAQENGWSRLYGINRAAAEILTAFADADPSKPYGVRNFVRNHVDLDAYMVIGAKAPRFKITQSMRLKARDFLVAMIRESGVGTRRTISRIELKGEYEANGKAHCSAAYLAAAYAREDTASRYSELMSAYGLVSDAVSRQLEADINLLERGVNPQVRDLVLELFGAESSRVPRARMKARLKELSEELDALSLRIDDLKDRMERVKADCRATAFHFGNADNLAAKSALYLVLIEVGEEASVIHINSPRLGIGYASTLMTEVHAGDGERWAGEVFDIKRY